MANYRKKGKYVGMLGALLVHVLVVLLLFLVGFTLPEEQEEGGVPVMMGDVLEAGGEAAPALTEVDIAPEPQQDLLTDAYEQHLLTQEMEETVAMDSRLAQAEREAEHEAEERRKAEEERRKAEERAAQEQRQAEETARRRVTGAFGRGAEMGSQGASTGTGSQGSTQGNATTGAVTGTGGYGTFNLGGRSLAGGSLPVPAYSVQEEGCVVVDITVNPEGRVVATGINQRLTNTVNASLRKAAEDAARRARFNAVSGSDNQTGTITYYFRLK